MKQIYKPKINLNLNNKIILINKPSGFSSYQIVSILKRTYQLKKVGHGGTLDPIATGLLIIASGKKTKEINKYVNYDKTYLTTIQFNFQTNTYDIAGKIINSTNKKVSKNQLIKIIKQYQNVFLYQTPPIFSALKVNGKKLYQYALKNQDVIIKKRKTYINYVKLIDFDFNNQTATISLSVAKGFYVRSFVNEVGILLNNFAYVKTLKRIAVGPYKLQSAVNFDQLFIKK